MTTCQYCEMTTEGHAPTCPTRTKELYTTYTGAVTPTDSGRRELAEIAARVDDEYCRFGPDYHKWMLRDMQRLLALTASAAPPAVVAVAPPERGDPATWPDDNPRKWLNWALEMMRMYERRLIEFGDPEALVYDAVHREVLHHAALAASAPVAPEVEAAPGPSDYIEAAVEACMAEAEDEDGEPLSPAGWSLNYGTIIQHAHMKARARARGAERRDDDGAE